MRTQRDSSRPHAEGTRNTGSFDAGHTVSAQTRPSTYAELSNDNLLLREALNNMTHGVVMYDSKSRIVVCNDPYFEIYGLSKDIVKPGCTLLAVLKQRKAAGSFAGNVRKYRKSILDSIKQGETSTQYFTTADGRTIHIINRPMAGGGWVVTHEDVTLYKRAED